MRKLRQFTTHIPLSVLLICSLMPVAPTRLMIAQSTPEIGDISAQTIASDYAALAREISYQGLPEILTNQQSTATKQGVALLVARTQLRDVPEEMLSKLSEQVAANSRNPALKLVTLADLNANSNEARKGAALKGSLWDFSNEQTALNSAIAQGIAMVLFVDLTHFNAKPATVTDGLNLLNARASLTLLNAADGIRIKNVDRDVKARGFDARDLMDKAFDLLAKDLSQEATRWRLPTLEIKLIQLEVHAKIDSIQFPMMDVDNTGKIQVDEVPVFAEGASVEIDGVLKGQAPCRIDVTPGIHKLKVYRDGTKPFVATIQVNMSNRYDALLVPTDESRRKFDEQLAKFEKVKTMALSRNVQMEREGIRNEGMRVSNENSRIRGQAVADVIQSRADVARTDSNSRAVVAAGEGEVLSGTATILNAQAKGEGRKSDAEAEIKLSEAEAIRKNADGKLITDKAAASNIVTLARLNTEALRSQLEAMKSFAESFGSLGFRLASGQRDQ